MAPLKSTAPNILCSSNVIIESNNLLNDSSSQYLNPTPTIAYRKITQNAEFYDKNCAPSNHWLTTLKGRKLNLSLKVDDLR